MLHIRSMWPWPRLLSTIWDCRDGVENSVYTDLCQPLVWPNPSHMKLKCGCKLFSVYNCLVVKFGTLSIVDHFLKSLEPFVSLAGDMSSLHLMSLTTRQLWSCGQQPTGMNFQLQVSLLSFYEYLLYLAQNIAWVTCLWRVTEFEVLTMMLCALTLWPTLLNSVHVSRKERWMI